MSHDATKVVMGTTRSSSKQGSESFDSSPLTFKAGLAVRRNSSNALSVVKADGGWVGVSLGRGLSDAIKTTVIKAGEQVPILVSRQPARGSVTITSYANLVAVTPDTITVGATVFTAQSGAATPGTTTFRAATGNTETAASLATQINAHATAGALVRATSALGVVTINAISNSTSGDTIALAYADLGSATVGATVSGATLTDSDDTADWIVKGAAVYISDETGMADDPNSNATISNGIYMSALMTGISEDGSEVAAAIIDISGGL